MFSVRLCISPKNVDKRTTKLGKQYLLTGQKETPITYCDSSLFKDTSPWALLQQAVAGNKKL